MLADNTSSQKCRDTSIPPYLVTSSIITDIFSKTARIARRKNRSSCVRRSFAFYHDTTDYCFPRKNSANSAWHFVKFCNLPRQITVNSAVDSRPKECRLFFKISHY